MTSNNIQVPIVNHVKNATTPGYRFNVVVPMLLKDESSGLELHLPMVVLTGRENSAVECNAYQDTLALFKGKSPKKDEPSNWDAILNAQRAFWIVFYSVRHPDDLTKKWFETKQQVEDTYTWDDIEILMNHHMTVRLRQPHLTDINLDDPNAFQQMIDRVKKMGTESDFFLSGLTTHSVNQLIKYLVAQLEISQKTNGSSGTLSSSIPKTE
jgi:hypothetical protein